MNPTQFAPILQWILGNLPKLEQLLAGQPVTIQIGPETFDAGGYTVTSAQQISVQVKKGAAPAQPSPVQPPATHA